MESIDRTLTLRSRVLGLELSGEVRGEMRFHDPATGEDLLSYDEEHAARQAAELRAEREAAARREEETARRAAKVRIAALEARSREGR